MCGQPRSCAADDVEERATLSMVSVIYRVAVMQTVVSKTFDDIRPGDTACVQRTLQASDVRAWTTAFGDALARRCRSNARCRSIAP
jgi:hypothetical protein